MSTKILISVECKQSEERLCDLFGRNETGKILQETFSFEIDVINVKPVFPTLEQAEYLRNVGVPLPAPETYRIYIGSDVAEVTERHGAVELPSEVLRHEEMFNEQGLYRIRRVIGSPDDN